ncbi:MAG: urease accessory protein UreE [Treponema sp.]|nr:urease accessory protein UreE [Treponema sp.]
MIAEKVLGKAGDAAYAGRITDTLDIEWFNATKRIDRKMTRNGKELGIRLDHETSHRGLTRDDVLFDDGSCIIVVDIIPCSCIRIFAKDKIELARLCYEAGNRHAPLYYGESEDEFLTPYEKPMIVLITELGLSPEKVEARLLPHKRLSSVSGHSH